jgi:hypothetical protein
LISNLEDSSNFKDRFYNEKIALFSKKLNSICKDPNSNSFAVSEVRTTDMVFSSSLDNVISSVAIKQSSAEYVLAAGMLVLDVLVLADNCTPYKCCIISLTLETIADLLE